MATKLGSIFLIILCTVFTSSAQIFYKFGSEKLSFNIINLVTNLPLVIGMALYCIGAIIMIIALKEGDVSVLYPIIATSYIWVSILSYYIFNDNLNLLRILGIITIIAGVIFISLGSRDKHAVIG